MAWKDDTTTPRTGAALEASVIGETFINADHPDYDGDIQAAIDAHTAGTIYVPGSADVRTITTPIDVPDGFSIVGDGPTSTIIDMASSPGAALYAIGHSEGTGTYYYSKFSDFQLRGPRHGLTQTYGGGAQTDCYGLSVGRRSKVEDVIVSGFDSNYVVIADHVDFERCYGEWGYHQVRFKSTLPENRYYDHHFTDCNFTGSFMSGFYVENGSVVGCQVTRTHFGFQPYCILAATSRPDWTQFMLGATFLNCNWESFGTAVVYSPNATDIMSLNTFVRCSGNRSATYVASGTTYDYNFYAGIIERNLWVGPESFLGSPGIAYIGSPATSGNFFTQNKVIRETTPAGGLPASRPFAYRSADGASPTLSQFEGADWKGRIVKCTTTVAAGQLVYATGRDTVAVITLATQIPVGVAMDAATTSGVIRIATDGYVSTMVADAAISAGSLLGVGVSTGDGRVAGQTYSTGTVVTFGVSATSAAAAGNTFQAHIRMPAGAI